MILAWGRLIVLSGWDFSAAGGLVLHGSHVEELLDSLRHVAALVAVVFVQLIRHRLGGPDVLCRRGVNRAFRPKHAGDGRTMLSNHAEAARPLRSRCTANGSIHLAPVGV